MPVQYISPGPPTPVLANVAYALPAVAVTLFADAALVLAQSNTSDFTVSIPVVLVDGKSVVSGGFIRSTTNGTITLKRN